MGEKDSQTKLPICLAEVDPDGGDPFRIYNIVDNALLAKNMHKELNLFKAAFRVLGNEASIVEYKDVLDLASDFVQLNIKKV